MAELVDEVTDLLQHLIRNRCVNDGTPDSGDEVRNADLLEAYLGTAGFDVESYESHPGRRSIVARIEGSDPTAPSLMLMGHTDVVPVSEDGWSRDPFGGELVDGFVWGRGAVDMFNLTSSMAVAFKRLADDGFTPRGDLIYLGVADEEAGGVLGAKWLVEHEPDAVRADYVLTEFGGMRFPLGMAGPTLPVTVSEKGPFWGRLRFSGTPGHGSMPLRTDNALVTASEAVRRLAAFRPPTVVTDVWRGFVEGLSLPDDLAAMMLEPDRIEAFLADESVDLGLARFVDACTHTTISPNVMTAGTKTNVIPDAAEVTIDIRALPGETAETVEELVREALGDLGQQVEVTFDFAEPSTESPMDTPLWDILAKRVLDHIPDAVTVPFLLSGATDSRFLRDLGNVCYGFGMYSERIPFDEFAAMFHGHDERIDQESLEMSTRLWMSVARDLLT